LGFETVAIARGADKEALARQLGAHHYIDNQSQDVGQSLQALGGATVVLATVTSNAAMTETLAGLAPRGELIVSGSTRLRLRSARWGWSAASTRFTGTHLVPPARSRRRSASPRSPGFAR
jgi:D-arabinose 1-dehydrogenase-like Zn-dependent alcohol dehydrogenase